MKKSHVTSLIITGVTAGVLVSNLSLTANEQTTASTPSFLERVASTGGNITYQLMTEDELLLQLNEEGTKIFNSLSPEGRELALKIASRSCNNTNECAGTNACRTDKNKCAGQGSCTGTTKCSVSDKNFAVKIAAKKMAEKRSQALQN